MKKTIIKSLSFILSASALFCPRELGKAPAAHRFRVRRGRHPLQAA